MLEQKIEALTAAVEKLTAVMQNAPLPETISATMEPAKKDYQDPQMTAAKTVKPVRAKQAAETPEGSKPPEYNDVKGPFIAFIESKGHEAAAALLAKFGIAKLPALPPEKFEAMLAAIAEAS